MKIGVDADDNGAVLLAMQFFGNKCIRSLENFAARRCGELSIICFAGKAPIKMHYAYLTSYPSVSSVNRKAATYQYVFNVVAFGNLLKGSCSALTS